ncbi:MAG: Xaa-Pro peptidase family protein [Marinobacter sp.]|uniref:M24 family metallopeptidase n=1 Tax=Marinobacter sp. TaxID=50741 RepID=UPI00299E5CB0|nr:Xaa-Pro peptidase family protein [Marinobacter sp.]MDX1756102.1 Xaa-Pro peptidase family protein [Marinobacter sp.]
MDFLAYQRALAQRYRGVECPFPAQELERRLRLVREQMVSHQLDALVLTNPADIYYLTGYSTFEVSVHTALVVLPGDLLLQVPSIEMGPAMTATHVRQVVGYRWERVELVLEPLVDVLAGAGTVIGVDFWHGSLRHGVVTGLRARLPQHRFEDASGLLKGIRIVKTAAELSCLEASARITGRGIEAAVAAVRPGVSDGEVAAAGARTMLVEGSEFMSMQPIVTAGWRSSVIHASHRRHTINRGEPVFLEFGSAYQRYTAPMMRTVVAGQPTMDMVDVFDGCRRIHDALCQAMKSGKSFDEAARAGEEALRPLSNRVFFSGVFGYAVGAQFPPSWVEGSGYIARGVEAVFQPNMVFHLPICLRVPGEWGIGCSDTVRVTDRGAVAITDNPWELSVVA